MSRWIPWCICFMGWLLAIPNASANDNDAIARGKKALESRALIPPPWTAKAYENAWRYWVPKLDKAPADYDKAFAAYYGLHPAPFENGRYPMGLRKGLEGKGVSHDCLTCHGGSIRGKSYIGLGNSSLDLQALFEDLSLASGYKDKLPYTASNVRGTNEAFPMAFYLFSLRDANCSTFPPHCTTSNTPENVLTVSAFVNAAPTLGAATGPAYRSSKPTATAL